MREKCCRSVSHLSFVWIRVPCAKKNLRNVINQHFTKCHSNTGYQFCSVQQHRSEGADNKFSEMDFGSKPHCAIITHNNQFSCYTKICISIYEYIFLYQGNFLFALIRLYTLGKYFCALAIFK